MHPAGRIFTPYRALLRCGVTFVLHSADYLSDFVFLPNAFMHFVQALTLLPEGSLVHWRFGRFFFLIVGLYFPRSFTILQVSMYPFPQIEQVCDMVIKLFLYVLYYNRKF